MAERRIDTLLVELIFRGDTKGLENVNRKLRDMDRQVQAVVRGAKVAVTAAIGIGTAAFFTGSKTEREFAKLQTQLGDTKEQVEAIKPPLRALSRETGQAYDQLAAAFFNLKSSVQGISDEKALEVITAAAKGATIELGRVDVLALLAGGAIRQFGLTGQKALDILHSTIKSGTIPDTAALASGFGRLLGPANELSVSFEEVGAAVAGASNEFLGNVSLALNSVGATLRQLLAPSTEAKKILEEIFPEAADSALALREMIEKDGLIQTLQFLRQEIGDDNTAFRQLLGDANAVLFALSVSGEKAGDYTAALEANRNALGSVNEGLEIYKTTGAFQAQIATNNLRLALDSLYNAAVVPLLQAFGKLPSLIQTVALGLAAMSAASLVLGGPSLGILISSLGRFIVALKTGKIWNSNFIVSLRLAAISVTKFAVRLWTSGTAALGRFATSIRTNAIPALSRFATTIWASTIGALRALGRRLAMASLAMLRFATRAIVAGISAVITFGAAIWASLIPPLIAATAAVVGFTVALLANPIVLIVMAIIGAFVALGFVVYKFRRQIVDGLMGVWNFIKDKWREIAGLLLLPILGPFALIATNAFGLRDKLIDAFTKVRDFFMGIWGTIAGIFRDHWAKILAVIFPLVGLPILIAQEWDQIVGFVGDIWSRVYDTVKGWIDAIIALIKEIPGKVKDAVKDIPVVGQVLDVAGGAADKAKGFLGGIGKVFVGAEGGIVPGPLGRPVPAIVHGGEMVLPVGASRVIAQMLKGFQLGPAALPQAPHYYGQMYRSLVDNRTVNINITEPIVIQTQATDAKGIAQELHEAIEDKIRNIAYDHDGPVER